MFEPGFPEFNSLPEGGVSEVSLSIEHAWASKARPEKCILSERNPAEAGRLLVACPSEVGSLRERSPMEVGVPVKLGQNELDRLRERSFPEVDVIRKDSVAEVCVAHERGPEE
jgi:hypothetical protein